jgi:glutamate-1-semialdehyde 2,1-aminomutase
VRTSDNDPALRHRLTLKAAAGRRKGPAEYRFASPAPRTGTEAAAASDPELDDYLHSYLANRGVLLTPFHNMALMSPVTTDDAVDKHTQTFDMGIGELLGADAG